MEFKEKVVLACNTLTEIQVAPYADHMNLAFSVGRNHPDIDFHQFFARRTSIDRFRNMVARYAIDNNIDYIFFIDDDMQFPSNTFTKLHEACAGGYDMVCALNYIRGYPFKIMAYKWDLVSQGKRLVNLTEKDLPNPLGAVVPCNAFGTAVCLLKVEPLKKTPAPWFITGPHGTEDIYMCLKVKDHYPELKLGMHTGVITGHTLDPEVISQGTRASLVNYMESFMSPAELERARVEEPFQAMVPNIKDRKLHYEDLMGKAFE